VDTHAATRVLDDDRIGICRLRCVPGILGCVELGGQGGVELFGSNQPLQIFTR
jgi:hypothetical protein